MVSTLKIPVLPVPAMMVLQIRENLEKLSKTAVYGHFTLSPGSPQRIPPFPREVNYQDAILISQALMRAARKNPLLARTAVSAYAYGVRPSDKLLPLTSPDHARFGRALIDLVRLMNLKWLRWRLVCPKTDEVSSRLTIREWLKRLELPSNTSIHSIAAKNKVHSGSANHIAVEVVEQHGHFQ